MKTKHKALNDTLVQMCYELARLASKTPQFYNPKDVWNAEQLRDNVLKFGAAKVAKALVTQTHVTKVGLATPNEGAEHG